MILYSLPSRKALLISNFALIVVIIALSIGWNHFRIGRVTISRDMSGGYKFTNPILDFEDANMTSVSIFSESVEGKVADLEKKYDLSYAAVYFRDLNDGEWIGLNEKEPFASASLIKLPIAMALYHQAELYPAILDKEVTILPQDFQTDLEQAIKPADPVVLGTSYSLRDLVVYMLEQSDNAATQAIIRNIYENRMDVFRAVGVHFSEKDNETMVSVKDYAGFFRVLFNASYLTRKDSETILGLLAHAQFDKGLVAGVPEGVTISHKFGERSNYVNGLLANRQLHDCGIVYYPGKPYLICIMTRGDDFTEEEQFIADMSRYFYRQVER